MSLETAIQENTTALRELIARLSSATAVTMTATEYVAQLDAAEVAAKKPAASQTAETTKAASAAPAAESPSKVEAKKPATAATATTPTVAATAAGAASIDYTKDVKPLLLKVSTSKGRDALVNLLAKFGVTKGDQLPADALGDVLTEVNELLAA